MSFNRNFPYQQIFKRYSLQEIHKLIVEKEAQGYEMVKPVYKQVITNKFFSATDRKRKRWSFDTDEEIVKWVAIMRKRDAG